MASHSIGTHKTEREEDIPFLKQILQAAFNGEIEVYTAILSVAECQAASAGLNSPVQGRIITDDTKKLFREILTSGQYVVLVQDTILIAERARNFSWVHDLNFSGADAVHLASALEMRCDEYLSFDEKPHKHAAQLEMLGLSVLLPRNTKSLTKAAIIEAKQEIADNEQGRLQFEEPVMATEAAKADEKTSPGT
jgi:predicted nucleic acid-binding protein